MRCATLRLALILLLPLPAAAQSTAAQILGREVDLSLDDAVRLALENNLNLEVARTDPAIANEGVRQATGAYDLNLAAFYSFDDDENPTANAVQSAFTGGIPADPNTVRERTINTKRWDYNAGLRGILPSGLSYSSVYNWSRTESDSGFFLLEPEWRAEWDNQLRLPLLKNFLQNEADVTVKRSRVAQDISLEDFRRQLIDEIRGVERSYWTLTAELDARRVAETSLETAQSLLDQTRVQYEVGVVSRVAVTQAVSGVARRESDLIVATNLADAAQDNLLNLIIAPGPSGYVGTVIRPESPTIVEYEVDLDATVERALESRPEVAIALKRLEDSQLTLDLAENQILPALDLVGSYRLEGIAGDAKPRTNPAPPPALLPRTFAGSSSSNGANDDFFNSSGAHSWSFRAEFSIPIPNTTARALATQRRIEYRRTRTNLRQTEQLVILEAREAARNLASALEAIEAEERAKEAAAESLRAEQEKLRLGDSTPFDVLLFLEDLAAADNRLVRALQIYRNAITDLERAQGTLLSSRGISFEVELDRY